MSISFHASFSPARFAGQPAAKKADEKPAEAKKEEIAANQPPTYPNGQTVNG